MSSGFVPFIKKGTKLVPEGADVQDYQLKNLNEGQTRSYEGIKSNFDPFVATQKQNRRFMLSELVADQLSVEEEELRRFQNKVNETVDKKLKELSDNTRAEAHKEGFEAGRKEAYDEEKAVLAKYIESLAGAVQSIEKAKEQLASQYESALIEMSFRLAKIIVNYEVEERPENVAFTINDILSRISKEDDVMIRLPAHEFEAIEKISNEVLKNSRSGRISFESDQRLETGSCVVESVSGEISSIIDEKFAQLEREIFSKIGPVKAKEETGT